MLHCLHKIEIIHWNVFASRYTGFQKVWLLSCQSLGHGSGISRLQTLAEHWKILLVSCSLRQPIQIIFLIGRTWMYHRLHNVNSCISATAVFWYISISRSRKNHLMHIHLIGRFKRQLKLPTSPGYLRYCVITFPKFNLFLSESRRHNCGIKRRDFPLHSASWTSPFNLRMLSKAFFALLVTVNAVAVSASPLEVHLSQFNSHTSIN